MSSLGRPENSNLIQGIARVIEVGGGLVRFEPEQQGGCGVCASAAVCNDKGIGTLSSRLATRRFELPNYLALTVGDRVVLGVPAQSLLMASALAYLLPLFSSLACAVLAQWRYGQDGATLLAALVGLLPGFLVIKYLDGRRGDPVTEFRILRRAQPGEHCN